MIRNLERIKYNFGEKTTKLLEAFVARHGKGSFALSFAGPQMHTSLIAKGKQSQIMVEGNKVVVETIDLPKIQPTRSDIALSKHRFDQKGRDESVKYWLERARKVQSQKPRRKEYPFKPDLQSLRQAYSFALIDAIKELEGK